MLLCSSFACPLRLHSQITTTRQPSSLRKSSAASPRSLFSDNFCRHHSVLVEGSLKSSQSCNEAEELVAEVETPEQEAISYTRNKPKRKPLPSDLPREVIVHDIPEADKTCDCCASELHCIGEDKSEKLQFIPAQVKVIEHVRPKYACRTCEKEGISNTLKQAPVPHSVIPKGYATPSLLSQIITSKYQFGLPLYRQEAMFKQHGIELSRKTMADWIIRCAELFKPLYDQLHQHLRQQPVIQADETTLKVVDADKSTSYMWLYATGQSVL